MYKHHLSTTSFASGNNIMNSTYCIFNKIRHFSSAILADDSLLCIIFFPYHAKYVDIFVVYYGQSVERSVADTVQS